MKKYVYVDNDGHQKDGPSIKYGIDATKRQNLQKVAKPLAGSYI